MTDNTPQVSPWRKHYSSRRKAGFREIRFWIDTDHCDRIRNIMKEMLTTTDHQRVYVGLLGLAMLLEQEDRAANQPI